MGYEAAKELVGELVELVDLFHFGTALYVIAIGTYLLFVSTVIALPSWLKVHDLDDLKDRLLGVVVVALAVSFLGEAIAWDSTREIMSFGIAIRLMIAAVAFFLSRHARRQDKS